MKKFYIGPINNFLHPGQTLSFDRERLLPSAVGESKKHDGMYPPAAAAPAAAAAVLRFASTLFSEVDWRQKQSDGSTRRQREESYTAEYMMRSYYTPYVVLILCSVDISQ